MEILLLIVIGLIAKNFKPIMEFLTELSQQYGTPPYANNSGGKPTLSKKALTEFDYEEDYYESKPKAYKVKSSQTGLSNQLDDNLDTTNAYQTISIMNGEDGLSNQLNAYNNQSTAIEDKDENLIHLEDLKKGVIWQEILEPPRARRPYRKII